MRKFLFSFLLFLFSLPTCLAQSGLDTDIPQKDTGTIRHKNSHKQEILSPDTLQLIPKRLAISDSIAPLRRDSLRQAKKLPRGSALLLFKAVLRLNPWFNFSGKAQSLTVELHQQNSADGYFYLFIGLVFYFGLIKVLFSKYYDYLLTVFLRASMRQQQIREQLLQTPLPSLLLNILFAITGGLYVAFLVKHYGLAREMNYTILSMDCCFLVGLLYLVKFFVLKTAGWVFNIRKVTDTYIFIVFMVNKILGILLLPILILLYFSTGPIKEVVLTISLFITGFLLLYRLVATYPSIRSEIKVSVLYFFLYLCAFEIAPLLLIYKVLLTYLEKAY